MQNNQNNVEIKNQNNNNSLDNNSIIEQKNLTNNEQNYDYPKRIKAFSVYEKIQLFNNQINKDKENKSKYSYYNSKNNAIKKKDENNIINNKIITKKKEIKDEEKMNEKLLNIKSNTKSLLDNSIKTIFSRYNDFSKATMDWYEKENKKINKLLQENNQNINSSKIKINERIKRLFQIHENLISSIKDQLTLLDLFLSDNFFDTNFPLEEFILKNCGLIINGNFLSKIDLNSIYLNKILENKDLSEILQNYYLKRNNNFSQLQNIKIKLKTKDDLISTNNKIHEDRDKENNFADKIKSISFYHLNLSSFPIERIEMNCLKHLEKLKIIKSTNVYNTNIYKSIIHNSNELKIIKLEGVQLTDKSFNEFISYITKDNSLFKTINYLSFTHNYLSSINLKIKKFIFENLEMLDFSNNNIYNFSSNNFRLFPKLKVLDLSNNNINNNLLFEGILKSRKNKLINFISFMSKNIFVYNVNNNNQKYIQYLNEYLPNLDYNLKNINLSLVYNQYNLEEITKLSFSSSIKISLVKLDLSFCGLNYKVISKFFINNYDLINLKKLNLNNNFISIDFFSLFIDDNKLILIDKIEKIDLSFNAIKFEKKNDLEKINIFIENHKFLKVLKLQNNNILNIFKKNQNIKQYNDEIDKLVAISEKRHIKIEVQSEIIFFTDNERFKKILLYKSKY